MSDQKPNLYPGAHLPELSDKPAIIMAETGATMTYAQLDAYANQLARLLQWNGLKPGDHIAISVENRLECTALQWGAHYAGLYYTFVSTRLKGPEAAYIVQDCEAQIVILSAETAPLIGDAIAAIENPPKVFCVDEYADLPTLGEAMAAFDSSLVQDTLEGSEMLYSSGTTGVPKGVKPKMTGLPLGSSAVIAGLLAKGFGVGPDTLYLSTAPYYHAAPLKWAQGVTVLGGTVVIMEKFKALESLEAVEKYGITHSQWVPTMFKRLLSLTEEERQRFDLSSQKVVVHAAAPCPVQIKQAMIDWWGPIINEYYSCTESIGMTLTSCQDWIDHPGSVGRALLGVVHILDEDGNELGAGEDGLVYFSDGPPFKYHKDDTKTAEAYNDKGWATVGDIGHVDEDGFLYLTDRKSNMIITGGVNVYPQEVENLLISHPKIKDAAVIGTPHEDFGEEVRAVVQLVNPSSASDDLAEELIAFCRENLSVIKCPKVVDFREDLPREPNGKLLKRLLKDEYSERLKLAS